MKPTEVRMAYKITLEPGQTGGATGAATVTARHFGSNYLATRQAHGETIEAGGAFGAAADWLDVTHYRYPGGTIAEKYFDITDPGHFDPGAQDALSVASFADAGDTTQLTRLGQFMAFAATEGGKVTVVVPMIRFFETVKSGSPAEVAALEADVKAFVAAAMAHPAGHVISGFELGNEFASWMGGHNGAILGSTADAAALMRNMAVWINEALDETGLAPGDQPQIIAQTAFVKYGEKGNTPLLRDLFDEDLGQDYAHVESVADFFAAIEGVATHVYPYRPWLDTDDGIGAITGDTGLIGDWQEAFEDYAETHGLEAVELDGVASEWNIRNAAFSNGDVSGAQAGIATVALFHRLVAEGVDEMHVWPALQNTGSTLIDQKDGALEMQFTGAAFTLLRTLVPGHAVEQAPTAHDSDGDGIDDVFVYSFRQGGSLHTFASAAQDTSVTLDFAGYGIAAEDAALAHVAQLNATGSGAPVFEIGDSHLLAPGDNSLTLNLAAGAMTLISLDGDLAAGAAGAAEAAQFSFAMSAGYADRLPHLPGLDPVATGNVMQGDGADAQFQVYKGFIFDAGGGADSVLGSSAADTVLGGSGADRLEMGAGDDVLLGESGDDYLNGGSGDDWLYGGAHQDVLLGGAGNDRIRGGAGFDLIQGGAGHDLIDGGGQADNLYGGTGNDTIHGSSGLDRMFGGSGDDRMFGGTGDDHLRGETGSDALFGGHGNDTLEGGGGNDRIRGGAGFDVLDGGAGNDILIGAFNADVFVFAGDFGSDQIWDFEACNDFEKIDLSGVSGITDFDDLSQNHMRQIDSGVLIDAGEGNRVLLRGVEITDLDANDFLF
ncbi:calcium-binding protein [Pseudooceanicola sediminis]|uniref:Calcium-binding protein n=2 Tax=Pseudooceanicola sediminis TaxID=2211117 RepID=A0A399IVI9_9RHOB|nr:calcium-binding protein [Pseudooceanicola sediminis]